MRVRATRLRRLRIRKAIGQATLAVGLLAVGMLYFALEKNVTLVVDGQPQAVHTLSGSVGQLLAVRGITLEPGDQVQPPPATALADGMTVVVNLEGVPAATALGASGSQGVGVWVVEGVSGSFAKRAIQPTETGFSADSSVGPARIVDARVVVKGKEHDVLTNAMTVRALLSAMGITPDGDDRVLPPPSAPLHDGVFVRYVKVDFRTQEVETSIPYTTLTTYSSVLPMGVVRIMRDGSPGTMLQAFRVRVVDGKVVGRELLSERVVAAPVAEQRTIGKGNAPVGGNGTETGEASWYDAPGSGFTAAHPSLPYGTRVRVTDLATGKSIVVVITDRGPFGGRIIDLSPEAFSALAPLGQGVLQVRLSW